MGVLKTLTFGLALTCGALAARADDNLLHHVAGCVGRLSAQMEHHWLFQDQPTDRIEQQRAHLIDILEAITTRENASRVLSGRIESKLAHASLLTRAAFSSDSKISAWAKSRVQAQINACRDIALINLDDQGVEHGSAYEMTSGEKLVNRSAFRRTETE